MKINTTRKDHARQPGLKQGSAIRPPLSPSQRPFAFAGFGLSDAT